MKRNVEIKARVRDVEDFARRAGELAGAEPETLLQRDVFFDVSRGRLKLRRQTAGRGELIFYERGDAAGPKSSDYVVVGTDDPDGLEAALAGALGVRGAVHKTRRLYLAGRTRIHLDEVSDLGVYMELEVVLGDGETAAEGEAEALSLMRALGVGADDLVAAAYIDLLEERDG
ncbi:class IV adenylate cyclase [bacterium]|nr:class IV adenylate cyclase [bacterium]MBU1073258.1 class IV adenylate cyclase [bacterium]MBU1676497.1 class IV adenylate cyclase [bacterium]